MIALDPTPFLFSAVDVETASLNDSVERLLATLPAINTPQALLPGQRTVLKLQANTRFDRGHEHNDS
jgi:hypothetical protein